MAFEKAHLEADSKCTGSRLQSVQSNYNKAVKRACRAEDELHSLRQDHGRLKVKHEYLQRYLEEEKVKRTESETKAANFRTEIVRKVKQNFYHILRNLNRSLVTDEDVTLFKAK